MKPPNYPVESVDNALKLLLALIDQPTLTVSEAGELLGVAPSTAHRLLSTLQFRGFVDQDGATRQYRAGPVILKLGLKVVRDLDLRQQARPVLERLAAGVGETANLLLLQGSDILFIDCVEGPNVVRVSSRVGVFLPAHCTAAGKALLAEMSREELRRLYPQLHLSRMTARSIIERSQLERELDEIRARGYAINVEESEEGLVAISAVIHSRDGRPLGAVAIAAPSGRVGTERVDEVGRAVCNAAKEIGDADASTELRPVDGSPRDQQNVVLS